MKPFLFACITLLLLGCSKTPTALQPTPKVTFEGMILPGTHADAKAGGFTECRSDYYNYECKQVGDRLLMGVKPISVKVYLDGRNNLMEDVEAVEKPLFMRVAG